MPLQTSGIIWLSQIRDEFRPGQGAVDLNSYYRDTGVITGNPENNSIPARAQGSISMGQFYGAIRAAAGAWDQGSPGDYEIWIPTHAWMRVRVWGAGGGGGSPYTNGSSGDQSYVVGLLGAGGGQGSIWTGGASPGAGYGGNQENLSGAGPGGGDGGGSPYGGGGGASGGGNGSWPGGGGGGAAAWGAAGAGFGHSYFGAGVGAVYQIHVGGGGAPGNYPSYSAGWGGNGRVLIEWGV